MEKSGWQNKLMSVRDAAWRDALRRVLPLSVGDEVWSAEIRRRRSATTHDSTRRSNEVHQELVRSWRDEVGSGVVTQEVVGCYHQPKIKNMNLGNDKRETRNRATASDTMITDAMDMLTINGPTPSMACGISAVGKRLEAHEVLQKRWRKIESIDA